MPRAGLRLAVTLLTAVPLPAGRAGQRVPDRRTARAAMYWAPAVGLALGGAAAGVLIGGITGDVLGALAEVTTAACLLVTAIS